jgi:hypothetical protein
MGSIAQATADLRCPRMSLIRLGRLSPVMGSGSEKGESIATDPGFAMYHQLSLTGSLLLDRAA